MHAFLTPWAASNLHHSHSNPLKTSKDLEVIFSTLRYKPLQSTNLDLHLRIADILRRFYNVLLPTELKIQEYKNLFQFLLSVLVYIFNATSSLPLQIIMKDKICAAVGVKKLKERNTGESRNLRRHLNRILIFAGLVFLLNQTR